MFITCAVPMEAGREHSIPGELVLHTIVSCCEGSENQTQVPCENTKCSDHWAFSLHLLFKFLISLIEGFFYFVLFLLFCFKGNSGQFYWSLKECNRPDKLGFFTAARKSEEEQVLVSEWELEKAGRLSSDHVGASGWGEGFFSVRQQQCQGRWA